MNKKIAVIAAVMLSIVSAMAGDLGDTVYQAGAVQLAYDKQRGVMERAEGSTMNVGGYVIDSGRMTSGRPFLLLKSEHPYGFVKLLLTEDDVPQIKSLIGKYFAFRCTLIGNSWGDILFDKCSFLRR